jgi:hypothetical protein
LFLPVDGENPQYRDIHTRDGLIVEVAFFHVTPFPTKLFLNIISHNKNHSFSPLHPD